MVFKCEPKDGEMKKQLLFAVLLVGGCATTETVWVKSGSTQQDFYVESSQCRAQGASVPMASMFQIVMVYTNCMGGKGWYQQEVPKVR
jgi:hypothetical protein